MPVYVTLIRWTDQGRKNAADLPDRVDQVTERIKQAGGKVIGNYLTMGRFDQVAVIDVPNDETAAKLALVVAGRGNAVTETMRAFTMDEVRKLKKASGRAPAGPAGAGRRAPRSAPLAAHLEPARHARSSPGWRLRRARSILAAPCAGADRPDPG